MMLTVGRVDGTICYFGKLWCFLVWLIFPVVRNILLY